MRYRDIPLLFLLSTLPLSAIPTLPWHNIHSKHSWKSIPDKWVCLGRPTADTTIDLYIAPKPHRENALVDALNEVSDPDHPRHVSSTIPSLPIFSRVPLLRYRYGMHLSREQVADLVAPHPETVQLVHSWLEHHRITLSSVSVTHGGSFLTVAGVPVSQANELLGASYQLYMHTKTNETIIRTLGYSLPVVLDGHVQTVAPTAFFSSLLTQEQTPRERSDAAAVGPGNAMDRKVVGVTGYKKEYPSPADLTSYMLKYRPDGIDATYVVESVNGDEYDPTNPGREANGNIQLTVGMTYPTPHIFYTTKPSPNNEVFLVWLNSVLSKQNVPQTITTSYGTFENAFPKDYALQVCNLFAQLGARGASVLFASGDDGVGKGDCAARFTPLFPATCTGSSPHGRIFAGPFVTAVGGTTSFMPEVAASLSGGGFSEYYPRPEYQQQAVSTFLDNLGQQYSGLYNFLMAAASQILPRRRSKSHFSTKERSYSRKEQAAQRQCVSPSFLLSVPSILERHADTAEVQIVAGIISLLNDYRISQGRPPLGFLNPWLYGGGLNGLNDIVSGSNPGCSTNGFSAIVGWDPVTGLGTPDFLRLMHALDPGSSNPPE
ncbi:peptidase S8/S53 domain-containing protein [Lactarius vividus]|nr:peptidase S8/S53 domain-containing protein [Lactarius vividus]